MGAIPLTRATTVLPFVSYLKKLGAPVGTWLDDFNLSEEHWLEDPETLVPLEPTLRMLERGAKTVGLEQLGVEVATGTHFEDLGVYGRVVCSAPSLLEALLAAASGITAFSSGIRVWMVPEEQRSWICFRHHPGLTHGRAHADLFALLLLVDLVRHAAGPDWFPSELELPLGTPFPPETAGGRQVSPRWLASPIVRFGVPQSLLARPLASGPIAAPEDFRMLDERAAPATLLESLRRLLPILLRQGLPGVEHVAGLSGMLARSLQRRLGEAGSSYRDLVEQERRRLALELLVQPGVGVREVARQLGYAHPSNFTHAFRRWMGESPVRFRSRLGLDVEGEAGRWDPTRL